MSRTTVPAGLLLILLAGAPGAAPVRMVYPEGPSHGFLVLDDERGGRLAHGELTISFDARGRYQVVRRATPDAEEERVAGDVELPDDVSNGMTSVLLKNLPPGTGATTHLVVFQPKPRTLELHLRPEGTDTYHVGPASGAATRFLVQPEVTGALGVVATVAGKQPPAFRMWIAQPPAPILVLFEGALFADGPTWRVEHGAPRWDR